MSFLIAILVTLICVLIGRAALKSNFWGPVVLGPLYGGGVLILLPVLAWNDALSPYVTPELHALNNSLIGICGGKDNVEWLTLFLLSAIFAFFVYRDGRKGLKNGTIPKQSWMMPYIWALFVLIFNIAGVAIYFGWRAVWIPEKVARMRAKEREKNLLQSTFQER